MLFKKIVISIMLFFLFCCLSNMAQNKEESSEFFPKILAKEGKTPRLILAVINEQLIGGYEYGKLKFFYFMSSGAERNLTSKNVLEKIGEHPTPRGRFSIFYKSEYHISSFYGSPMPWMLAFDREGHSIHKGELPGYPSSHGCIRLFGKDAKKLFYWADIGTVVLIVNSFEEIKK